MLSDYVDSFKNDEKPVRSVHIDNDADKEKLEKLKDIIKNSSVYVTQPNQPTVEFGSPVRFQLNRPHYDVEEDFLSRTYNWTRVPQKGETVYFRSANTAYDVVEVCAIVDNDGCIESYRVTLS